MNAGHVRPQPQRIVSLGRKGEAKSNQPPLKLGADHTAAGMNSGVEGIGRGALISLHPPNGLLQFNSRKQVGHLMKFANNQIAAHKTPIIASDSTKGKVRLSGKLGGDIIQL